MNGIMTMQEKIKAGREELQRIRHHPVGEVEETFCKEHLVGYSDPAEWTDGLVSMVMLSWTCFQTGVKLGIDMRRDAK